LTERAKRYLVHAHTHIIKSNCTKDKILMFNKLYNIDVQFDLEWQRAAASGKFLDEHAQHKKR